MSEQGGKLLRLVDHPRFSSSLKDPDLVEVGPDAYITQAEWFEIQSANAPAGDVEDIDWENGGEPIVTDCRECNHRKDTRSRWRQRWGSTPELRDLRCALKRDARCDAVNAEGNCYDVEYEITYG
jgi:hypothetical protein